MKLKDIRNYILDLICELPGIWDIAVFNTAKEYFTIQIPDTFEEFMNSDKERLWLSFGNQSKNCGSVKMMKPSRALIHKWLSRNITDSSVDIDKLAENYSRAKYICYVVYKDGVIDED